MNILVCGADGYLGWPLVLKISREFPESRIIAIDHFGRRRWVTEVGADTAVPICPMAERLEEARKRGHGNISFIELDLSGYQAVKDLISIYRPEAVLNLAAQPSAPYSQISTQKAIYTQQMNMAITRNLLWALRETGQQRSHYIETTTTGIYGAPSFTAPEGDIEAIGADGSRDMVPYPNMASSWYHVSKGFNATNMRLMNFQTGMPITDVRTSIVYGNHTQETRDAPKLATRFDFDFYFGTLFNRWCAMGIIGEPLVVYGSGNQVKPFIYIEDAAQSLVEIVKRGNPGEYRVYNQLTEYVTIGDLARMISSFLQEAGMGVEIKNIPNPRVEKENVESRFDNQKFMELLGSEPEVMEGQVPEVLDLLIPYRGTILRYKDRIVVQA